MMQFQEFTWSCESWLNQLNVNEKQKQNQFKPIYDKNAKDLFLRNLVANWDLFI